MRSKEDAQDYRYFPDPDLTPIVVSDEWLAQIKADRTGTSDRRRCSATKKNLICRTMISKILTGTKKMADLFEETTAICNQPKKVSNWLMVQTMQLLKENRHGS